MTANPSLPPITCPTSLVASCAPLLGFVPKECVVAFVLGVPDRSGPVLIRLDLGDGHDARERARELTAGIVGTQGSAVDLVAWIDAPDDAVRAELPSERFVDELFACLDDAGVGVASSVSTNGRVWWSHDCPDVLCCGDPQPLDPDVLSTVQAEYVYAGFAPLASRAELSARIEPDHERVAILTGRLSRSREVTNPERWREVQIGFLSGLLVPGWRARSTAASAGAATRRAGSPIALPNLARCLRGLQDVRVRDVVLHRMILAEQRPADPWRQTVQLLEELVRCAPERCGAPPATLLAIVAWMRGDGASANIALDRAEADDQHYQLALLTRQVITRGVDPVVWRRTMATLTEAECRGRRPDRSSQRRRD